MERWANKLREITQGFVGSKRKTLIEYGVYGLRYAASTPWLNRKKKGSMAGYDPAKGRFGTYAINQAKWFMRQAVSAASKRPDQEGAWPLLLPRFVDKITEFREWAAMEISTEVENSPEAKKSEIEELTQFFLYFVSPYTSRSIRRRLYRAAGKTSSPAPPNMRAARIGTVKTVSECGGFSRRSSEWSNRTMCPRLTARQTIRGATIIWTRTYGCRTQTGDTSARIIARATPNIRGPITPTASVYLPPP